MKTIEELEKEISELKDKLINLKKSYRDYTYLVTLANVSDGYRIFSDKTLSDTEKVKKLREVQSKIVKLSIIASQEIARLTS